MTKKRKNYTSNEKVIILKEHCLNKCWWRITSTSQWIHECIDLIGTAMISITGCDDRLRMFALLAHVNYKPMKASISFAWKGAWEYD